MQTFFTIAHWVLTISCIGVFIMAAYILIPFWLQECKAVREGKKLERQQLKARDTIRKTYTHDNPLNANKKNHDQ